jgi:hypothetical protein
MTNGSSPRGNDVEAKGKCPSLPGTLEFLVSKPIADLIISSLPSVTRDYAHN